MCLFYLKDNIISTNSHNFYISSLRRTEFEPKIPKNLDLRFGKDVFNKIDISSDGGNKFRSKQHLRSELHDQNTLIKVVTYFF
jgi:hypothetical protein